MRFQYALHDAGWATATISCHDQSVEMTASYLHDSLKDMASGVVAILNGSPEVTIVFMDEPGEHQVVIRRLETANVLIEVDWYAHWRSWGIDGSAAEKRLACVTRVQHLRGQVLSAMRRVLSEHGEQGYKEKWGKHEFPIDDLRRLETA